MSQSRDGRVRMSVDVVIPVLNEQRALERGVAEVRACLAGHPEWDWTVVVVDNGSTDGTRAIGERLAGEHADVRFLHLDEPGRGGALRRAWCESRAEICCYTDVDLSTDLGHLAEIVDAVRFDGCDIAIGSRLMPGARSKRSLKREAISRIYNVFVKLALGTRFSDAQCGFKAVSRRVITEVVPQVQDQSWFFDTELLARAEKQGFRIKEVPVHWIDDDDSRVEILKTAYDDIKGVLRVRRSLGAP